MERLAFNLLFNSACSFLAGGLVVMICLWLFRVDDGRWKLYLLSLPFVKMVWDLAKGIPQNSVLLSGVDLASLPPRSQGMEIKAGFSELGPILNVSFLVRTPDGAEYSISLADYLHEWISRHLGENLPGILLSGVCAVSLYLVFRRIGAWIGFERRRRSLRAQGETLEPRTVGRRLVDVYACAETSGSPFTGGLFKPYICIPAASLRALSEPELEAVIRHECAHIAGRDLAVSAGIAFLGDVFWFVPGYRWLKRRIERLREILADAAAVASGADRLQLASALVKLKELHGNETVEERLALYSALFKQPVLLKTRIQRLIGEREVCFAEPEPSPRLGWQYSLVRIPAVAWTTGGVLLATVGGNYGLKSFPAWLKSMLEMMGMV